MTFKRKDQELVRIVVARRTKGEAFFLNHEAYRKRQQEITTEVQTQLTDLGRDEFIKANPLWLWDEKI